MERHQKRHNSPGREHRPEGSRGAYSDEQETYRNPRNEYRDDHRRSQDEDLEMSRYGGTDYTGRNYESNDSDTYGASERGYGYSDRSYRNQSREFSEPGYSARREEQRDTWAHPESGEFSEPRSRWPRDDRYRTEPRSQNWPHSRTGGRISEYGYFDEEGDRSGYGGRQQGGSRYGSGSRPQGSSVYSNQHQQGGWPYDYGGDRQRGTQYGYGAEQQSGYGSGQRGGMEDTSRRFGEDYSGRGPKNYSRSDERIREDICDELSSDPECNAENVEIEVKDGVVTLSGEVPSRRMKHRAEDIADQARGVKDVENRIRVTGRGQRSSQSSHQVGRGGDEGTSANDGSARGESPQSTRSAKKS
jgi:osmotically-inducible protein OsmY